ncbi:MAG: hypothetical protein JSS27_12660 [Planctomycetes bacterium]|nr:hypothetical protein [Planctomycetota bacterium]
MARTTIKRRAALSALLLAALALVAAPGCRTYMVGTRSLYPPNIRTVHVPIFESNSFRRDLGEQLTEAVVKEIELKTPFKVVGSTEADSVLSGRIVGESKQLLVKPPTDEQRLLQTQMMVQVSWVDRRGSQLQGDRSVPVPQAMMTVQQVNNLVPEMGQTITTQQQQSIQRLAEQIVSMMEAPW